MILRAESYFFEKVWKDGTIYVGEWKDGVPHGKGKLTLGKIEVYEGDFREGRKVIFH